LNLIFLARQEGVTQGDLRNYLTTAESELERVSHLARQTLGYYRDTGSPSEVHLHDLIENVLAVYRNRLLAHGIEVEVQFNDLRKILVRPGEIVQVLSNVVVNAVDAMPQGGKLSISTNQTIRGDEEGLQVAVSDTGPGIRRENIGRVFDAFFTTKGNLGTGIGLWVARQIVERHGGQISISSSTERDDSGTLVTVDLPFGRLLRKTPKANGSEPRKEIQ
jgi:signal transduction histidine kinase